MIDIDAFLKDAVTRDTIPDFASPSDHFSTGGGLQLDFSDNPRRLRSGHVLDFKGATLELDTDRVTDAQLRTEMPLIMLGSEMGKCYERRVVPEEAWAAVSNHISVKNVKLVANYSKLAPRARALGVKQLAITGAGIQGHDAHVSVTLSDFGAYGREGFPAWITGVDNSFDQYAIYGSARSHIFDEQGTSSSLEYRFADYVPEESDSQVTVGMISGALCPGTLVASPWSMSGPWRHIMRCDASLKFDVETPAGKPNLVQGGTIYQSLKGTVDGRTRNARVMYYSDYYKSRGVHVLPTCSALECEHGVIIQLSPTASGYEDLPPCFSAEDFVIEYFECRARKSDVFLNADLLPGASKNPATRYLRNIAVDERLSVSGNKEGLVIIPGPKTKRTGCRNPFNK